MAEPRICSVDGCDNPTGVPGTAKGLCSTHYQRLRKNGHPLAVRIKRNHGAPCSVDGCDRPADSKSFCAMHYSRMRNSGTVEKRESKLEWIERHASYEGDDCIRWPYSHCPHGRGILTVNEKGFSAPNFMCRAAHGEPPSPNMEAAHSCGNGHLGCINPRHLSWSTRKENEADKLKHGTLRKGADINTCKLTEQDIQDIRSSHESGASLARRYGVTTANISRIRLRKTWKHVK